MTTYDNWKLEGHGPSVVEEEAFERYLKDHPGDADGDGFPEWYWDEKEADEDARGEYLADLAEEASWD